MTERSRPTVSRDDREARSSPATSGPRGEAVGEGKFWGIEPEVFGEAAKPATFVIDVRAWVPRKLAALSCHRTQVGPDHPFTRIDEAEARRLLGLEHFRRAPIESRWESIIEQMGEPVPSI